MSERSLLETNIKFIIRDALAKTADTTGLRAGDASEKLIEAIWNNLISPHNAHWRNELAKVKQP